MYNAFGLRAIVAIVVVSCMVSRSCYSEDRSTFTHADILTVLRDQEERIEDFLLEFDSEETERTKRGAIVRRKRENVILMAKGALFRTRKESLDPETQDVILDQEFAGDGSVEYFYDRLTRYGTVRSRAPEKCAIRQSWASTYLLSVMRSPRRKGNFGFEGNLIGALEEAPRGIKISEESINGRRIVVLARFSSPGIAHSEIRLDPQMSLAVLSTTGIGMHRDNFSFINSDFVEVIDGIWLPRKVERVKRDKTSHTRHEIIRVKTLKFNEGYEKADFAVRFPDGVEVGDLDAPMDVKPSAKGERNELCATIGRHEVGGGDPGRCQQGQPWDDSRSHLLWRRLIGFIDTGIGDDRMRIVTIREPQEENMKTHSPADRTLFYMHPGHE